MMLEEKIASQIQKSFCCVGGKGKKNILNCVGDARFPKTESPQHGKETHIFCIFKPALGRDCGTQ